MYVKFKYKYALINQINGLCHEIQALSKTIENKEVYQCNPDIEYNLVHKKIKLKRKKSCHLDMPLFNK